MLRIKIHGQVIDIYLDLIITMLSFNKCFVELVELPNICYFV